MVICQLAFVLIMKVSANCTDFCCRFYDGGYLHLKSSIMRTHGAKELRDTLIETPRDKLTKIVQVCSSI